MNITLWLLAMSSCAFVVAMGFAFANLFQNRSSTGFLLCAALAFLQVPFILGNLIKLGWLS